MTGELYQVESALDDALDGLGPWEKRSLLQDLISHAEGILDDVAEEIRLEEEQESEAE